MSHQADFFQCHVAARYGSFVILLQHECSDEADDGGMVVRGLLVEAWTDENQSRRGPAALDLVRQNLFITVTLNAILSSLGDGTLRQRTHDAYKRRLERLGLLD